MGPSFFSDGRTLAVLTPRRGALGAHSFARTRARHWVSPRLPRNLEAAGDKTLSRAACACLSTRSQPFERRVAAGGAPEGAPPARVALVSCKAGNRTSRRRPVPISCLHDFGGPTCSHFSLGYSPHTFRVLEGPKPTLHTSGAQLVPAWRRIAKPDRTRQSQVGRNRQTPQRASEVISGNETPPLACCLTRTQQLPLHHVRSLREGQSPSIPKDLEDHEAHPASCKGGEDELERTTDGEALERAEHLLPAHRRGATIEIPLLATHRGRRPSRPRGNRSHPSALREDRDHPAPRRRPGHLRPGHDETHRFTVDRDMPERVEHIASLAIAS